MAKVYLVKRIDKVGYDEYDSFVVVAKSTGQARDMCKQEAADEGGEVWLSSETFLISKHPIDSEPRIVLGSFNAG